MLKHSVAYPFQKNKRTKKAPERTPCKQEGWDSWIFLPGNNVTFAFDSDQSKQATGFTVLWSTYDSPKPTPPPPDVKKSKNLNISMRTLILFLSESSFCQRSHNKRATWQRRTFSNGQNQYCETFSASNLQIPSIYKLVRFSDFKLFTLTQRGLTSGRESHIIVMHSGNA